MRTGKVQLLVLILVVVDNGLVRIGLQVNCPALDVLILVVVDNGLVPSNLLPRWLIGYLS